MNVHYNLQFHHVIQVHLAFGPASRTPRKAALEVRPVKTPRVSVSVHYNLQLHHVVQVSIAFRQGHNGLSHAGETPHESASRKHYVRH